MNNNKLIALFMGLEEDGVDGYLVDMDKDYGYQIVHESCFLYHSSWDWLMPVVSKCFKTGDDTHQWDNIMDTIFTCDINIVYAQVVEFIKEHNNER